MRQPSELTDEDALRLIFNQLMLGMRTNIPAIVDSDAPYQKGKFFCVTAIPAINLVNSTSGTPTPEQMKPIQGIPIFTPCGGGFSHTVPLKKGDSVWLSVSDRGIDNWQLKANTQDAPELTSLRHHDLTDCVAIVGGLSVNQASSYYNDGIAIQNAAGSTFAHVNDASIEFVESGGASFKMEGGIITIVGEIQHTGNQTTSGVLAAPTMNAATSLAVAGKEMDQHIHSDGTYVAGTTDVSGNSGAPV